MPEGSASRLRLGGDDGRTLLLCCAPDFFEHPRAPVREAVLLAIEVEIPHAGLSLTRSLHRRRRPMTQVRAAQWWPEDTWRNSCASDCSA